MGKPTLTDTKNSKAGKKLARNNGPAEEVEVFDIFQRPTCEAFYILIGR